MITQEKKTNRQSPRTFSLPTSCSKQLTGKYVENQLLDKTGALLDEHRLGGILTRIPTQNTS